MFYKIGKFLHENFDDFTKPVVLSLFSVGIVCAVVGHYGVMGFKWKWFLFFDLPLYIFCGWALWSGYKLYRESRRRSGNKDLN